MAVTPSKVATTGWFPSVLFLLFLTLKLCHVIDWSWWWVTAPLWGPFCAVFGVCVLAMVVYVVVQVVMMLCTAVSSRAAVKKSKTSKAEAMLMKWKADRGEPRPPGVYG